MGLVRRVAVVTLVLLATACGTPKGSVDTCVARMLTDLHNGVVNVGYPEPECGGLSAAELRQVDVAVAEGM